MHLKTVSASGWTMNVLARAAVILLVGLTLSACTATGGPVEPGPKDPNVAEPYVAKGRVTDSQGNPLSNIEVFADNTAFYNMNIFGTTDAAGYYRIELGDVTPSSWRVGAYVDLEYNGVAVHHALHPSDDTVFAGVTGAVRNLSWQLTGETPEGGYYGGLVYVYESLDATTWIEDMDLVELTFEPLAPLFDGTQGTLSVRSLDGGQVADLAVTRYLVSARYHASVGGTIDLLIRERDSGAFGAAVNADFGDDGYGYLLMELEVKLP